MSNNGRYNHNTIIYGIRYAHINPSQVKQHTKGYKLESATNSYLPNNVVMNCFFRDEEEAKNVTAIYNMNSKDTYYKAFKTTEERLQHISSNFQRDEALRDMYGNKSDKIMNYTIYDSSDDYFATLNETGDKTVKDEYTPKVSELIHEKF